MSAEMAEFRDGSEGSLNTKCPFAGEKLEAAGGVEPPMEILQTSALPLGYAAPAIVTLYAKGRRQSTYSALCPNEQGNWSG
jgi:hypothetical protein